MILKQVIYIYIYVNFTYYNFYIRYGARVRLEAVD